MNSNLLAWAAGFIDGEGTISMYERTDRDTTFRVKLSAVNTHLPTVERLQSIFGGSIQPMRSEDCDYAQNWKPAFCWTLGPKATEVVIRQIQPYLFTKLPQAKLALEARQLVRPSSRNGAGCKLTKQEIQHSRQYLKKFRKLNKKGKG